MQYNGYGNNNYGGGYGQSNPYDDRGASFDNRPPPQYGMHLLHTHQCVTICHSPLPLTLSQVTATARPSRCRISTASKILTANNPCAIPMPS